MHRTNNLLVINKSLPHIYIPHETTTLYIKFLLRSKLTKHHFHYKFFNLSEPRVVLSHSKQSPSLSISTSFPCPHLTLTVFSCLSCLRTDQIRGVAEWWWCKVFQSGVWRWWSFSLVSTRRWSMRCPREMSWRSQIRVE